MDALIVLKPFRKQLFFLARADVFKNPVMAAIMRAFHMLPIYRPRDGKNSREKNMHVFDACYALLERKQCIMIHPEGNCYPRKQVRMLKKGFAHMAFGAEFEMGTDEVQIVPVNIEYEQHTAFRKTAFMHFGEAIAASDYKIEIEDHHGHALNHLRNRVAEWMHHNSVDFEYDDHYRTLEWLSWQPDAIRHSLKDTFTSEFEERDDRDLLVWMSNALTAFRKRDEKAFEAWTGRLEEIRDDFKKRGLDRIRLKPDLSSVGSKRWLYRLASPIMNIGLLHIWPAERFTEWFIDKNIGDRQFITSIRFLFQMLLMPLSLILAGVLFGWIMGDWRYGLGYFGIVTLVNMIGLRWIDLREDLRGHQLWEQSMADGKPHQDHWQSLMDTLAEEMPSVPAYQKEQAITEHTRESIIEAVKQLD
jgi:hypothetical protein